MTDVRPASAATQPPTTPLPVPVSHGGGFFHTLLRDLNPLQYIPVVGTIYREVTGDEGNPTMRMVASLGTSFALGGPIGVAITAGEDIAGIDPERMALNFAEHLFHIGRGESAPPTSAPTISEPDTRLAFAVDSRSMSADDLNGMELQRLNGSTQLG